MYDLVERLRAFATDTAGAETWETRPEVVIAEAADAIERLRDAARRVSEENIALATPALAALDAAIVATWNGEPTNG